MYIYCGISLMSCHHVCILKGYVGAVPPTGKDSTPSSHFLICLLLEVNISPALSHSFSTLTCLEMAALHLFNSIILATVSLPITQ